MVGQKLRDSQYQSKEAKLFFLKDKVEKVSDFIWSLRKNKGKAYLQIMAEVTGIEALVTLQSFLLQVSLYYRKYKDSELNEILEIYKAHLALAKYYKDRDFTLIVEYLKQVKTLFILLSNEGVEE